MSDEPMVSAEVLVHDPARAENVAGRLNELGLAVLSVGNRSVSVQTSKERFERLFRCRLVPSETGTSPAEDFGPLGGESLRAAEPPEVPPELREEVESVEIQPPPLMF